MTADIERIMTDEGRNNIRQFLIDAIDEVSVGTGASQPRSTDTTLDSESFRSVSSNEADGTGQMVSTVQLGLDDANGEQLSELMLHIDDKSLARIVFGDTEKTENLELAFETRVTARNPE